MTFLTFALPSQVEQYTKELKSKNLEIGTLRVELEEANIKFAQTDSMLISHHGELRHMQNELRQKESELNASGAKVRVQGAVAECLETWEIPPKKQQQQKRL